MRKDERKMIALKKEEETYKKGRRGREEESYEKKMRKEDRTDEKGRRD